MDQAQWTSVDSYFTDLLLEPDPSLDTVLAHSGQAQLPAINVAPNQGKLLYLLALMKAARRILEIGTLGGYSTIWLARALPEQGKLVSLELDGSYAALAAQNIALVGESGKVEIRVGPALDSLRKMVEHGEEPFDLIFIDADKEHNPQYLELSLALSRAGTVIIGDNVVRKGEVVNASSNDPSVRGVRRFCELMATSPRLTATAVQTVGSKGWDGFSLAMVTG
ncbi:O-methyltransferase [Paralcaligenes sp. KSB-10]|uniref:O-methyltransferase n=1 Tax=Paralcaligenes sp. KSB-10 TaxID=2901142 RepID=UPI001E32B035|nr:O-methyltransferase [Paralcaligenes sp. KSB-10]UHL63372.1 O-methyltransferase [Paralcaligenes sp. KSB-10]